MYLTVWELATAQNESYATSLFISSSTQHQHQPGNFICDHERAVEVAQRWTVSGRKQWVCVAHLGECRNSRDDIADDPQLAAQTSAVARERKRFLSKSCLQNLFPHTNQKRISFSCSLWLWCYSNAPYDGGKKNWMRCFQAHATRRRLTDRVQTEYIHPLLNSRFILPIFVVGV